MRRNLLGTTDISVPALALGASPLGSTFRRVGAREARDVLAAARELGIDLVDVAPYYGLGEAESRLGAALRATSRDGWVVATKVGRYGPEIAHCDYSAARVRRSIDESLLRLGLDHVDLLQVHDVEFGDLAQIREETLPTLEELRREGKTRWIGVTGLSLDALAGLAISPHVDTVMSYCRLTLHDQALAGYLPGFEAAGVGVLNAAPLAMGLLSARGAPRWHPAPEALKARCALAAEHCRRRGTPIEELAVAYAASAPGIATAVVGSADPRNLRRLVAAVDRPLDDALLAEVLELLEPVRGTTWAAGRPENA